MKAALAALVGPHNLLSLLSEQVLPTLQSGHRGTSLMRNNPSLGPYDRLMPRALWWSYGKGVFVMSEVPL